MATYVGTSGNDSLFAGDSNDDFDYSQGGSDTLSGGNGTDTFYMGAALDAGDQITAGLGFATLQLEGDYSAGLTLAATTFTGMSVLELMAGFDYRLVLAAANVGGSLQVNVRGVDTVVDASAASGLMAFNIYATGEHTRLIGGSGPSFFDMNVGLTRGDVFVGGAGGQDELDLRGQAHFKMAGHTMQGIERLGCLGGADVVLNDANVAAGRTLIVSGQAGLIIVDAHKETDGHIVSGGTSGAMHITGGALADTLGGSTSDDVLAGRGGADQLLASIGADTFVYRHVSDSTVAAADEILDLDDADHIDLTLTDADTTRAGRQHFVQVEAFSGHAGELTLTYDSGTAITSLAGDTNGDGEADFLVRIDGDHHDFTGLVL